jgi:hypothetical protein
MGIELEVHSGRPACRNWRKSRALVFELVLAFVGGSGLRRSESRSWAGLRAAEQEEHVR